MSRRILSALLALILVATFATVSKADVTGSFEIDIELIPMGNQTEAVKFFIDFQSNLVVNVLLSGLTFGVDIGFGVTGVEFAVLSLRTSLGALAVDDEFVFASPFGCAPHPAVDTGNCPGITVIPVGDENGDGVVDNGVGFVKKRIGLQLTIAGISLENLAIFEDVDFPDINSDDTHSHDHFGPLEARGGVYHISMVNTVVSDATPTFGFGDVIKISGETVSGITVSGATAICAGGTNTIKKKSWTYEVNKACTSTLDNSITAIEGGAKTPLLFEEETLSLGNIEIGGVTFSLSTTFKPGSPLAASGTASFNVLNLADVVVSFSSTNITNLTLSKIVATILADNLTIVVTDTNGDLVIDQTDATLNVTLNPNANAAALTIKVTTKAGTGLTALTLSLSITRTILTFSSTTVFGSSSTVGTLAWSSTSFSLSVAPGGDNLSFKFTTKYTPSGMGATKIELNVGF